jgi:Reverse transcriptase (RNA-dependent DNA polymerase)
MTDLRLFFALAALENKLVFGADVSNTFAEAHAPAQIYFMQIDVQFCEWWCSKGHLPISQGFVVPILKNLQGHPEAPCQWSKHIDTILQQFHFIPTVHAPCLYCATFDGEDLLFLHQVDDFAIATNNEKLYTCLCDSHDATLLVPMKRHGLLTHYNGLDIIQARNFISVNCGSYVHKLMASHGWTDMHPVHLPVAADNAHIHFLDTAVPLSNTEEGEALEAGNFCYQGAVGEHIWAMITCRPEISFPIVNSVHSPLNLLLHTTLL